MTELMDPLYAHGLLGGASGGAKTFQSQSFSTSGSFVVPAGVTQILVLLQGGGGGGGVGSSQYSGLGPGGGEGGIVPFETVAVTPGETLSVVIGAGGAGGTAFPATAGGSGGTTMLKRGTVALKQATGGDGGIVLTTVNNSGAAAGSPSNAIGWSGAERGHGTSLGSGNSAGMGDGGGALGGRFSDAPSNPAPSGGPGCGGAGGPNYYSGTGVAGNGGAGRAEIRWMA